MTVRARPCLPGPHGLAERGRVQGEETVQPSPSWGARTVLRIRALSYTAFGKSSRGSEEAPR